MIGIKRPNVHPGERKRHTNFRSYKIFQLLRKYCFNNLLNCARFSDCLIFCGNSFHNLTPEYFMDCTQRVFLKR